MDNNENTIIWWQRYKEDIERQFIFFGITNASTKKDGLLIYEGEHIVDVDDALPDPASSEPEDDEYTILIK